MLGIYYPKVGYRCRWCILWYRFTAAATTQ